MAAPQLKWIAIFLALATLQRFNAGWSPLGKPSVSSKPVAASGNRAPAAVNEAGAQGDAKVERPVEIPAQVEEAEPVVSVDEKSPFAEYRMAVQQSKALRKADQAALQGALTKQEAFPCAIITAVYDGARLPATGAPSPDLRCKKIVYSNQPNLQHDGSWTVVTEQYHLDNVVEFSRHHVSHGAPANSIHKFYKMQFHTLPEFKDVRVAIWIDSPVALKPIAHQKLVESAVKYGVSAFGQPVDTLFDRFVQIRNGLGKAIQIDNLYQTYIEYLRKFGWCEKWWLEDPLVGRKGCEAYPSENRLMNAFRREAKSFEYIDTAFIPEFLKYLKVQDPAALAKIAVEELSKVPRPAHPYHYGAFELSEAGPQDKEKYPSAFAPKLIAMHIADPRVRLFLDVWWEETMATTTMDDVTFAFVPWKTGLAIHALPDGDIVGQHEQSNIH